MEATSNGLTASQIEELNQIDDIDDDDLVTPEPVKAPAPKPWLAAGFKSRAEWRASKVKAKPESEPVAEVAESVEAAAPKKAVRKRPIKKPAKKVTKPRAVKKSKEKTSAEKKAAHERTSAFKKSLAKRELPNDKEKKVLQSLHIDSEKTITELSEVFSGSKAERYLKVKNALRWLVATKKFKQVGRGTYRRIA